MDDSMGVLFKTLGSFCNHLQNSCDALNQSLQRRPIPLDSASSTFVQCVNRRVSSTSTDLSLVDSMSFGTVSFEELLGHCTEVYKKNQSDIADLQHRLRNFGYIPEPEIEEEEEEEEASNESHASAGFEMKTVDEDPLLEDSLSLKDLGLSDVCLATIASEANSKISPDISSPEPLNLREEKQHWMKGQYGPASKFTEAIEDTKFSGEAGDDLKSVGVPQSVLNVSKDYYDNLPSYMKTLASWEDLLAAVEKMKSILSQKQESKGGSFFHQDDFVSMELGPKGRSYLLLLLRMNLLAVETIDGLISYRLL